MREARPSAEWRQSIWNLNSATPASHLENLWRRRDLRGEPGPEGAPRRPVMLDAMFLAIGFGFLAAAVLYVTVCDRL
jgi:hypothetical protein